LLPSIWLLLYLPLVIWLIGWHKSFAPLFLIALSAGALLMGLHLRALQSNAITPLLDKKISAEITASIVTDPKLGEPKQMSGYIRPATTTALITVISIRLRDRIYPTHLPLRMTTSQHINYLPGTVMRASGIFYSTPEKKVAGLFAEHGAIEVMHGAGLIGRATGTLRADFRSLASKVGGESGALIPGLVLGDTSLESHAFTQSMLLAGLTHLTAVSGENFAVIAAFLMWLLQWCIPNFRARLWICALVLIAFIFLVRPSPSVLRATVMVAAFLIAKARGSRASPIPALGLAITVLILLDPFEATDPGFALSVAATAGILFLFAPISAWLQRYVGSKKVAELLAISIAANLICTPITVAISGNFTFTSLPANFLAEPFVAPITVVGLIAALISPFASSISYFLLLTQKPLAWCIVEIARVASKIPVLHLPKGFAGGAIALLVLVCGWTALRWRSWQSL
jgi:competence protein ComEC